MNIDLTKLSPAPWEAIVVDSEDGSYDIEDPRHVEVGNVNGKTDAEFIALARNAFDVQVRRGWFAVPKYFNRPGTFWIVRTSIPNCAIEWKEWPDPFTALVEADRWATDQENANVWTRRRLQEPI